LDFAFYTVNHRWLFSFNHRIFIAAFSIEPLRITFTNNLFFGIFYTSIFTTLVTIGLQTKFQKDVTPAQAGINIFVRADICRGVCILFTRRKIHYVWLVGCALIFTD
jgi:hypothetical protein